MEKLRLSRDTERKWKISGLSLRNIPTGGVQKLCGTGWSGRKTTRGNLTKVQFLTDEMLTGEYRDMELCTPEFTVVQKEGILLVGFGLQEIPAAEKQQEEIHMALSYLTDEEAATVSGLYPEWKPDTRYQIGRGLHTRKCCTVQNRTILRTGSILRIRDGIMGQYFS